MTAALASSVRHRVLGTIVLTLAVGTLAGCPETDRDRSLHISNDTEDVVRMATVIE